MACRSQANSRSVLAVILLVLAGCAAIVWRFAPRKQHEPQPTSPRAAGGLPPDTRVELQEWRWVDDFPHELAQFKTVFWCQDDTVSLRHQIRTTPLVRDKTVLEIGSGTGLVSLCCLKHGARKVVATDINPSATANTIYNAEMLNLADRLETRLVPLDHPSAWAVVGAHERFDLILSNPPWEDATPADLQAYAQYDESFSLLRSLLSGLKDHLTPNGKAFLAYGCVTAVRKATELAPQYGLHVRILDERKLDTLPEVFLPGMLLEVSP